MAADYAFRRIAHRRVEFAISVWCLAAVAAAMVVLVCLPSITAEQTLRSTLAELAPERRSVTVVIAGERTLRPVEVAETDKQLRARLRGNGLGELRYLVSFRALAANDGTVFRLGGATGAGSALRIVAGRAARPCEGKCDVVEVVEVVGTDGVSGPTTAVAPFVASAPIPELSVVGRAVRTDPSLFSAELGPELGETLLIADGTIGVDSLASLRLIRRIHAWVAPILPEGFRRTQAASLSKSLADASAEIDRAGFAVTAPEDEINEAIERSQTAARALAMPRGAVIALFAVAVVLVGISRRTSVQRDADRLTHRGATPATVRAFASADAGFVVLASVAVGVAVGLLAVVWLAGRADLPAGEVLGNGLALRLGVLCGAIVASWVLLTCVLLVRDRARAARSVHPMDLVGLGSAVTLGLLLSRGSVDSSTLSATSSASRDLTLWVVPMLVALIYVSICARIIPPIGRRCGVLLARSHPLEGVAVREALGKPVAPLTLAASVVLAVAVACFGLTYRSTLQRSNEDQATFLVPYDATLSVSSSLVRPTEVEPEDGWASVGGPGEQRTTATEILRRSVSVFRAGSDAEVLELLALDPRTLSSVRPWRDDYGPGAETLGHTLAMPTPSSLGEMLPAGTRALGVSVHGFGASTGISQIVLSVIVERADGTWHEEVAHWVSEIHAVARLGANDEAGRLIGFRVSQPPETAKRQEHHSGEGKGTAVDATGVTFDVLGVHALAPPEGGSLDTDPSDQASGWSSVGSVSLQPRQFDSAVADLSVLPGRGLRVRVELQGTSALIVPRVARPEIPVLTDPLTASAADQGTLIVETLGQSFDLRVVAVAQRFPTLGERFVVADIDGVSQRFNLVQPTYGTPTEVWLGAAHGNEAQLRTSLQDHRYDAVGIDNRSERVEHFRIDPIGRASLGVLNAAVILGSLLSAFAVAINVRRERVDDAAFHRALLLDGASPARVRRLLWVRSVWIVVVAVPLGLLGGLALTRLVLSVVSLSSTAATPQPPLAIRFPFAAVAVTLLVLLSTLISTAMLVARSTPLRMGQSLLRGSS